MIRKIPREDPSLELLRDDIVYDCNSNVSVNDVVYFNAGVLNRSSNNDLATLPPVGIVRTKPSSATAQISRLGKRGGFSGLTVGARYYVGIDGAVTPTVPTGEGAAIFPVGIAATVNALYLNFGQLIIIRS